MSELPNENRQLRTMIGEDGALQVTLERSPVPEPGTGEVLIRIEAAPINPSDLGLLLGPAEPETLTASGEAGRLILSGRVPERLMRAVAGRIGQSLPVGNEGAGRVVRAGAGAEQLLGKVVGVPGGAMYADYIVVRPRDCIVMPDGIAPREAAAPFVNPLTALAMVETMRMEGHKALVHTAAASNLGQMLCRICQQDEVELVNVVRRPEQAAILRDIGAKHVVDSSDPAFMDRLTDALAATGATIAFDAIGGGRLASQILTAMEAAAGRTAEGPYSRYGSTTYKQVYIYGALDTGPTELTRSFGFSWGVGGFLLTPFLQKVGPEKGQAMRERVAREIRSTFASGYAREISLEEALDPEIARAYAKKATGEKMLINPTLG